MSAKTRLGAHGPNPTTGSSMTSNTAGNVEPRARTPGARGPGSGTRIHGGHRPKTTIGSSHGPTIGNSLAPGLKATGMLAHHACVLCIQAMHSCYACYACMPCA